MATPLMSRQDSNQFNCGCASRKQFLVNLGANAFDIAVTLTETGSALNGKTYPYGDGKKGDSANFGLFKNNWYAIRTACSQFAGQGPDDWNNGDALNHDSAAAIKCQHEQRDHFGSSWFAVQRNGQSGVENPATADIEHYHSCVSHMLAYINQGHLEDDMATYDTMTSI
ncbi:MAG: hypothetical protein M4579_005284 [Chaenotheca gracillima]|nr:MAG: hypothetical protein M4579_005284 [Chaenotheca gracillima]